MQLKVDDIEKWEDVVSSVDKEHIPIDCVKKVTLKLRGGRQKTINLETLRRNGLDVEDIEGVVARAMAEGALSQSRANLAVAVTGVCCC